jgi:signal transduction histidine kinase
VKPLALRTRMFLASGLVAVASIGSVLLFVSWRVTREGEKELQRSVAEAADLVARRHEAREDSLVLIAHLLADLPRLKAAIATADAPTVQPVADDYRSRVRAAALQVFGAGGGWLAAAGEPMDVTPAALAAARRGETVVSSTEGERGLLTVVAVPVAVGPQPPEVVGVAVAGFSLDDAHARELAAGTGSQVVFTRQGRVHAASLGRAEAEALAAAPLDAAEYVGERRTLHEGVDVLVLRSRSARMQFLRTLREGLLAAAGVGLLAALALGWAVARTVTRPLGALTDAMREMAATGDLARKIRLRHGDADTRVLAAAFDTLTDNLERFQRENALRERLSALGRLSTVIAHEVRNPLMIVKANLRTLERADASAEDVRECAAEIGSQVTRLNRVVSDVLDFARPVPVAPVPTDVNAVCREAAEAVGTDGEAVRLVLDPALPAVRTDGERLRAVLVNLLTNAREAGGEAAVELRSAARGDGGVELLVHDDGAGIEPALLPRIWEPYFTTRRTGSGLGLAIVRNVIDALGARVEVESAPGSGTTFRVALPAAGPGGPA